MIMNNSSGNVVELSDDHIILYSYFYTYDPFSYLYVHHAPLDTIYNMKDYNYYNKMEV